MPAGCWAGQGVVHMVTPQLGTAAVTSVPLVWLLVPFDTALLFPARRTQTWEKTFAVPVPTPPGQHVLKSVAPPVSTHSMCFPRLQVQ